MAAAFPEGDGCVPRGGEAGGERLRAAGRDQGAARSRAAGGAASCWEGSGRCRDCRPGTRWARRVSLFTSPPKALARGGPAAAALCKRPGGWEGAGPLRDGARRAASRPGAGRCAAPRRAVLAVRQQPAATGSAR